MVYFSCKWSVLNIAAEILLCLLLISSKHCSGWNIVNATLSTLASVTYRLLSTTSCCDVVSLFMWYPYKLVILLYVASASTFNFSAELRLWLIYCLLCCNKLRNWSEFKLLLTGDSDLTSISSLFSNKFNYILSYSWYSTHKVSNNCCTS